MSDDFVIDISKFVDKTMRRLILALLLSLLSVSAQAAITLVGTVLVDDNSTLTTATVSKNWTAGNSIIAVCVWGADVNLTSVSLGGAQSLTATRARTYYAEADTSLQIYYLGSIASSGTVDLVMTQGGAAARGFYVLEVSGGDTANFFDADNTATNTTGSPSLPLTTAGANAAIAAIALGGSDFATGDFGATGTGYVSIPMANFNTYVDGEYNLDVGAAGSKTVAMTSSSGHWTLLAAAFKSAGGGSAGNASGAGVTDNATAANGSASGFSTFTITEVLIDRNGFPAANISGIKVLVWRASEPNGNAPDQVITGETTDASGVLSFTASKGSINPGDKVFVMYSVGTPPTSFGAMLIQPTQFQ